MAELPFDIPPSLTSYLEQYESAPKKILLRLEKQLQKRGADPVGYFLLAWFYHKQEQHQQAVEYALKAKTYAPGSPFFDKLHYFFSHPNLFDAWCNTAQLHTHNEGDYNAFSETRLLLDLDTLIEKLSNIESNRITFDPDTPSDSQASFSKSIEETDNIVSETLAKIHEQQGKITAAINTYKKLKANNKEKKGFYDKQIKRLKELQTNQQKKKG